MKSALLAIAARRLPLPDWIGAARAQTQDKTWRHGLSLYGDLKYQPGFKQFEYVNAAAPKGGTARQIAVGTFDNFNIAIAGVKGSLAAGMDLLYETLSVSALDEVSSEYGLVAEAVSFPSDSSSVSYRLRPQAKWHDGKPITPDDVIFSFNSLKQFSPQLSAYYRHVTKAEKTGEREVTFVFDAPGNRELPQIIGQLTVLPKHRWEGTDANGKQRNIGETTLEPLLGSGPYRIKDFSAGRNIVFERVKDHWSRDLNVNVGLNNFDELQFLYFRDTTVALEAFKADTVDWRNENSAKNWATAYDFPAVSDKRVLLEEFPIRNSGVMQAFAFNIRRPKFQDPRLRLAFNCAFDFEEMNKQIFFNQYKRITSYFEGTELASSGLPSGRELELLEAVRDKVPPEVFKKPYTNPVNGNPEQIRANLREALHLLKEAGYEVHDQQLVNVKTGEPYSVEILASDPSSAGGESLTAVNERRGFWGSQAADQPGSLNMIGIKNPAVDAMIDQVIFAKNRADLEAATHALDRILLWNHYVVPQWTYGKVRTARWDRFGHPDPMPKYGRAAFPTVWWWDTAKAAKTAGQ